MYRFGYFYVNQLNFGNLVSIIGVEVGQKVRCLDKKCPKIDKEVEIMICPDCKKDVRYNRIYCPHCGGELIAVNKKI